jgi:hypothetical protein
MPWHILPTLAVLLATAGCAGATAGGLGVTGRFERDLIVEGRVDLTVRVGAGSISVRSGPAGRVHVTGRIRAHGLLGTGVGAAAQLRRLEANPPVEQHGRTIVLGGMRPSERWTLQQISIDYDVIVPKEVRVEARTGSGPITLDGVRGPLDAVTGSGRIDIAGAAAPVRVQTGSGRIMIHGATDGLEARSGSGSIDMDAVGGTISVRTGSGRISVDGRATRDWTLHTGSGGVSVHVAKDMGFEVSARTGSGTIRTSAPIELTDGFDAHHLRGRVRGGGARLELATGSGRIDIN